MKMNFSDNKFYFESRNRLEFIHSELAPYLVPIGINLKTGGYVIALEYELGLVKIEDIMTHGMTVTKLK